jgi:hypothetical protein
MSAAGYNETMLAKVAEVNPKTVSRWLASPDRIPHPRHRWVVCDVLGAEEAVLWPGAVRGLIKTGTAREIEDCWPTRATMPNNVWPRLLGEAKQEITLAGWTCYFLWLETNHFGQQLRRKAESGCSVRFLIGSQADPATAKREAVEQTPLTLTVRIQVTLNELDKIRTVPGVEARYADERLMHMSVFRFDDRAIVTPHLAKTIGKDAPTLLLRRLGSDGLFDQFTANHVEQLWTAAKPVW